MPRLQHLTQSLLLCSAIACGSVLAANAEPSTIDDTVNAAAQAVMEQYAVPGLAIGITVNGEQRFYNFGVASKTNAAPVTNGTLFEVGSISKTFTATLAAYAEIKGHLSLADSPAKYLPQLQGTPLGKATLLNLGTHTAGGFPLQVPENIKDEQQLLNYFSAWQPSYEPGTKRTYANPSIGLLGVIAAKSMNAPFKKLMETELLPALAMGDSYLDVPPEKMAAYAQGYNKQDAPVRMSPGVLDHEAYGLKTTSRDLVRFMEANMQSSPPTTAIQRAVRLTHTGYFQVGPMTQDLIWEQYSPAITLESLIEGNADKMAHETNPATRLDPPQPPMADAWLNKTGSTGGFGAYIAFVPAKQMGIVILANKNYPNEARVRLAYQVLGKLGCCSKPAQ